MTIRSSSPRRMLVGGHAATACTPEEQKRLMVTAPATLSGRPASSTPMRATFMPCSPSGMAQPTMTSPMSVDGSKPGHLGDGALQHMRQHVVGTGIAKNFFRSHADRGAGGGDDVGVLNNFGHYRCSLKVSREPVAGNRKSIATGFPVTDYRLPVPACSPSIPERLAGLEHVTRYAAWVFSVLGQGDEMLALQLEQPILVDQRAPARFRRRTNTAAMRDG